MNGYNYNGGYDPAAMGQAEQYAEPDTMMMGQGGAGHGLVGGQSLDDIMIHNASAIRRQSMPQQYGGGDQAQAPQHDMRRVSMMDYSGAPPAGTMNHYGYDQNASLDQNGMMSAPSPAHAAQIHPRRRTTWAENLPHGTEGTYEAGSISASGAGHASLSRQGSGDDMNLTTNYGHPHQGYNQLMANSSSYATQPAHTHHAVDMAVNSPYIDPNMGIPMDYGVPHHPNGPLGGDAMNAHMYSQPPFSNSVSSSPLHQIQQHGPPSMPRPPMQDPGGNSSMAQQFGKRTSQSGSSTARVLSRSHSMHTNDMPSPAPSGTPTSQPVSNAQAPPVSHANNGFPGQPQHPQPGSAEDRGMGGSKKQKYDGLNGPYPVDPANYNPNNQGLPWEPSEGGWPSTMVGKPHMQSSYKNAYSSTGFDMLGVLMRVASRPDPEINIGSVDLSCAFVVCDAEKDDIPIVYCSDNFERLTGYTKHMILGRNCRFLQSPDGNVEPGIRRKYVDDDSVLYLKNMINLRREAQISLINYRRGGQPFMNLLTMIPITWESEQVKYFVGFQVDLVEQPNAVTNKNPDGSYQINYQRGIAMPRYVLSAPESNTQKADLGQSVPRDDVSSILTTIGTGESEYAKRMWDKVLLENTDDVVHVLSLKGLFQWVSPSALRVLEYEPSEIIGTALSSVCHPSDIVPVTRELKDTSSGASVNVVFRIRRKNSGYMWFEGHGSLHTEQGKGRKSIIMVGRERPVYALNKYDIVNAGGIGENELWSKMSTSGMFLYVSSNVRQLLDRQPEELVGVSIQSLMRSDSKSDFGRVLEHARTGKKASVKHEMINRRGQVMSAYTTLYPGDATEGLKPTFIVAQTRLIKHARQGHPTRPSIYPKTERQSNESIHTAVSSAQLSASHGDETPNSAVSDTRFQTTDGSAATYGGHNGLVIGHQDASLASEDNLFDELKTTKSSSWQYEIRQLEKRNRLLAEEVQALIVAKKKRKRRKNGSSLTKDCANCHT
ncbi:hypothetical protein LTR53_011917 [Teratosphaeriaceae sp. CCFEE 6253]|nr:hypothetical protein LTR53_011917 [Teratosphaeriaceae sp. CCFEE 6253]